MACGLPSTVFHTAGDRITRIREVTNPAIPPASIEVVVGEATALRRQDAVIGVFGRMLRSRAAECRPLLHTPEDEIDAIVVRPIHGAQPAPSVIFFAYPFLGPLDRSLIKSAAQPAYSCAQSLATNRDSAFSSQGNAALGMRWWREGMRVTTSLVARQSK
jgi:hypothetical protein